MAVQEGDFPVPFEESIMSDQNSSLTIPSGWILRNEIQKDGSTLSYYFCEATGQLFGTYDDLMRYVNYAREAMVSVYSPDFKAKKLKTKAVLLATRGHAIDKGDSQKNLLIRKPRRKHLPIRKAGRKQLPGQNSRSLSVKRSKVLLGRRKHLSGKEIIDLEESTGPEDGAGLSAIPDSQSRQATGTPASPFITAGKEIIDLEESTGAEYGAGLNARSDSLHHWAGGPSPPPFITAGKEIIDLEDSSGAEDSADLREVPKLISTSLA
ncbi:hypothetical protein CJ030_MR5G003231 [Morella rubra]|uniref:MBD domain-containing protein n=1 Tax=Morella rubra TaxID=262757 RepID=A0A6A1VNF1_9ROSI|nr:hypothetical protein CJ030_MR5G003231 [Morella rubra]